MKVMQVIYSGLGGHAPVAFSFIEASKRSGSSVNNTLLFYGIEPVNKGYAAICDEVGVPFIGVRKKRKLDLGSYWQIFRIFLKQKPDVILLHSVNLIVVAWVARLFIRTKVIAVEHQSNQLKRKVEWLFTKLCFLFAHKVVFLTDDYKEEVKQHVPFYYRERKVAVVPNGLNVDFGWSAKLTTKVYRLGMISRLNSLKDHATLIEAFKRLNDPDLELYIAGAGDTLPPLIELVKSLSLEDRIHFLGLIDGEEVNSFFKNIDIYVHASLGETMNTALMNAMAYGLPIVASDVKGINNMVQHGVTGILVPGKDSLKLAEAIKGLMDDPKKRLALSTNSREYALQHFSDQLMFRSYAALWAGSNKIIQLLYSGLGGHGSVVFSMLEADKQKTLNSTLIFYGIEPVLEEYDQKCKSLNIKYYSVLVKQNQPTMGWIKMFIYLMRESPSYIINHSTTLFFPVYLASKVLRAKFIAVDHTPKAVKKQFEAYCSRLSMKFAHKYVVLSTQFCDELRDSLNGKFIPAKMTIIPNGINTDVYSPIASPSNDVFTLGMVSRFSPSKDHISLLRAFAELLQVQPNVLLRLAGGGETLEDVKAEARRLGIQDKVIFEGILKEQQVVHFLRSLNLYVHISKGEVLPTSILQAMSCELATVASNIPGIDVVVVNNETGLLITNGNIEEIKNAILLLMDNNDLREQFAANGRKIVLSKFTSERMVRQYAQLLSA